MKKDKKLNLKKHLISNFLLTKVIGGSGNTRAGTDHCTDTNNNNTTGPDL